MSIRKGTTIIAGNASSNEWTGTLEEYNIALENGTIKENMVCYITDDILYAEDFKPELDNKANIDLSNLSPTGEARFASGLNNKITNCLLEVPQRIKYTVGGGVITILAGSVITVPYGTEDLTAQHPVGSVFLHDKFKVVDRQFADGKFFVWVELQGDLRASGTSTEMIETSIVANITGGGLTAINTSLTTSSSSQGTGTSNTNYRTDLNVVQFIRSGALNSNVGSFPIIIAKSDGTNIFASVKQVFNGMGYIGSTVWIDKGIKGLIPNGRNEDGTLNNIEVTTTELSINNTSTWQKYCGINSLGDPYFADNSYYYNEEDNINIQNNLPWAVCVVANIDIADGKITNFEPKLPFRAVDYNDFEKTPHIIETYKNGTSWYRVWSDGWKEQGGYLSGTSVTFLKQFNDANYTLTYGNTSGQYFEKERFYDLTTAGFKIVNVAYGGGGAGYWYACGY